MMGVMRAPTTAMMMVPGMGVTNGCLSLCIKVVCVSVNCFCDLAPLQFHPCHLSIANHRIGSSIIIRRRNS
jgi:hypothetical protein